MSKTKNAVVIPGINQFRLMKVKKNEDGGLHIKYSIKTDDDGKISWIPYTADFPYVPAPELSDALRDLNEPLFVSNGMRDILKVLGSKENLSAKELEAAKTILPIVKRHLQTQLDHTEATGFVVTESEGDGDSRRVLITGKRTWPMGGSAFNSPLIALTGNHFGFEGDLKNLVDEIIDELYQYIFEGKRSQLQAFEKDDENAGDLFSEKNETVHDAPVTETEGEKKPSVENMKKNLGKNEKQPKKIAPSPAKKKKQTKLAKQTSGKKKNK